LGISKDVILKVAGFLLLRGTGAIVEYFGEVPLLCLVLEKEQSVILLVVQPLLHLDMMIYGALLAFYR
jgi:hypothetical protein